MAVAARTGTACGSAVSAQSSASSVCRPTSQADIVEKQVEEDMSDEDISMGEHAIDALYDTGFAVGALVSGEFDVAGDRFLDASSSALDAISDGGFSHLVDRFEGDTGIDTREAVEDGVQYVGEALGDAAWEATEWVGETVDEYF
jgi:hypothetical protein